MRHVTVWLGAWILSRFTKLEITFENDITSTPDIPFSLNILGGGHITDAKYDKVNPPEKPHFTFLSFQICIWFVAWTNYCPAIVSLHKIKVFSLKFYAYVLVLIRSCRYQGYSNTWEITSVCQRTSLRAC